ncbi:MAG TPA: hypothetical protein VGM87_19695 [Roseomonas sp.]|jgi:hypothetical protein
MSESKHHVYTWINDPPVFPILTNEALALHPNFIDNAVTELVDFIVNENNNLPANQQEPDPVQNYRSLVKMIRNSDVTTGKGDDPDDRSGAYAYMLCGKAAVVAMIVTDEDGIYIADIVKHPQSGTGALAVMFEYFLGMCLSEQLPARLSLIPLTPVLRGIYKNFGFSGDSGEMTLDPEKSSQWKKDSNGRWKYCRGKATYLRITR